MLPSSVSKCMTTNYDAIIYDHDHSKHISDHLRCRQDNGATCLNCKVDVFLEMQTTASLFSLLSFTPPPFTFEMQTAWVSHSLICPSPIHITCAHSPSFHLALPFSRSFRWVFQCALVWSKTALWHCARHPGSRKHQTTKEQLAKKTDTEGRRRRRKSVHVCDKHMNKLTRQERGMTLSLPSARRWKVGRCPSEVHFCTDLKEEGRDCIRAAV